MSNKLHLAFSILALVFTAALTYATPITIQTTGVYSSFPPQDALVSPGSTWQLTFNADSQPAATNVGADGFDLPFSNFEYKLNGNPVAVSPDSIRLYRIGKGGLFTVFFGPENSRDATGTLGRGFYFSGLQTLFRFHPESGDLARFFSS